MLGILFLAIILPLVFSGNTISEEINWDDTVLTSNTIIDTTESISIYKEIETTGFFEPGQKEILYSESETLEVKKSKLKKEDILKAVPSITTEDDKTLGLLIPPFAYFAKRF